jgi:hypothetical protein
MDEAAVERCFLPENGIYVKRIEMRKILLILSVKVSATAGRPSGMNRPFKSLHGEQR